MIWQLLYWKFVLIDRRTKIASGQRTTSFSFLLNDKRGVIGRSLSSIPEYYREATFMGGQLGKPFISLRSSFYVKYYHSVCRLDRATCCFSVVWQPLLECSFPPCDICCECMEWRWILYWSIRSQVRTLSPFSCSATYSYNHVRRFERELEALRKELADATARSGHSSPTDSYVPSHSTGDEELAALSGSPVIIDKPLPSIITPETATVALPANKKTV